MLQEQRKEFMEELFSIAQDYYKSNGNTFKRGVFKGARRMAKNILTEEEITTICHDALENNPEDRELIK